VVWDIAIFGVVAGDGGPPFPSRFGGERFASASDLARLKPLDQILGRADMTAAEVGGVPRSTKMGNILSPCPYDAGACSSLQSSRLRLPAILHSAFSAVRFTSVTGPVGRRPG
jgi:hypothetical protein